MATILDDKLKLEQPAVLLFGAGASHAGLETQTILQPPVDKDFFTIANQIKGHGTPALAKRVLQSVWELYDRVDGITLEEYYRDIETRAAISRIAKSTNKPKDWSKRQSDLEELIRRVYIQTSVDLSQGSPKPRESHIHQHLLDLLKPGSTVVTFNYDMLIEESFKNAKLWNPTDGYGVTVSGKTHEWCRLWLEHRKEKSPHKSKIHLLKLHGTLGWKLFKTRTISLKARPYYVRKGKREQISVLPPGWNKRIDVNPYRKFWREARLKLEKCKALVIIGYSLPDTDLLAKSLLAEVARKRSKGKNFLKQLIVVDVDDAVKTKFVRLMTPALGPYARIHRLQNLDACKKLK